MPTSIVLLPLKDEFIFTNWEKIVYMRVSNDFLYVTLENSRQYIWNVSLTAMKERIETDPSISSYFIQTNRSIILNLYFADKVCFRDRKIWIRWNGQQLEFEITNREVLRMLNELVAPLKSRIRFTERNSTLSEE